MAAPLPDDPDVTALALRAPAELSLAQQAQVREFLQDTEEAIERIVPKNTESAYRTDFEKFREWCLGLGFEPKPASEKAMKGYMTYLALQGRKPTTIARRLSGIAYAHREQPESPLTPAVRRYLAKIRQAPGINNTVKQAPPLLVPDLKMLVSAMDNCDPQLRELACRDKAVLLIGWVLAFRRSEIVGLDLSDVRNTRGARSVFVRKSKTDKTGKGIDLPLNRAEIHPELCPIAAVDAWIEMRGRAPGALFWKCSEQHQARQLVGASLREGEPMPWVQVNRLFMWWVPLSKAEPPEGTRFSPHSLRSGYITETIQAGLSPQVVMGRSRHKSAEVFHQYVRVALKHQNDPTKGVI